VLTPTVEGQLDIEFQTNLIQDPKIVATTSEASVAQELPLILWHEMAEEEVTGNNHEETITFEFPIRDPGGTTQMKNIPHLLYQIFMVWPMKTPMHSYLSLMCFVGAMITLLLPKS
jgi:hypothetical protein